MREWFSQLPSKIVEFWKKYTKRQKALFFSVLAAVLVAVIALVAILNRTSYVVLSTFEDTATAAQAANLLEDNSITYKVSDDALKIEVDENQVSQARLLLGENGIGTNNGQSDYDSLFNNSFNTTDSEKKLKAKLYKQSEMERDIASMQGVTKASVTINLPESTNTVYASDQTASVSIMLTINGDYNQESTNAIVEYAKTCVGNSDTKAITIVDNKGELLFSGQNSTTSASPVIMVQQQAVAGQGVLHRLFGVIQLDPAHPGSGAGQTFHVFGLCHGRLRVGAHPRHGDHNTHIQLPHCLQPPPANAESGCLCKKRFHGTIL